MLGLIKESSLIEDLDLRKQMIGRVEVLEKVKELILLPNTELMTTKLVAGWYEVETKTIEKLTERNRNELRENGFKFLGYSEIKEMVNSDNMSELKISRRGANVFSKRALLNVGMLLRDSEVAQRVRTALLDQQETITDEQKTLHIDKEKELALSIMFADNEEEKMVAFNSYRQYKNRHIENLERTIDEQKPKVDSYNTFMDGSNYKKMNDVAKSLGYGRNKLFAFLREQKILMKDNLPYQKHIDSGHFKVKETPIKRGEIVFNKPQTYVSAKGEDFINKLLNDNGIIRQI